MAILSNKPRYFFQRKGFRIGLLVAGAVVVIALVVFNEQIGQLLDLFGSKAGTQDALLQLDSTNFDQGTQAPTDSFRTSNNRLMLNSPGDL